MSQIYGNSKTSFSSDKHFDMPFAWIIDLGATNHVCYQSSLFTQLVSTTVKIVHMPNGMIVQVTHIGLVQLSNHILLTKCVVYSCFLI